MKDNRYMKCETITGEWWYKDLQTGEDLPKYATPIIGLEKEPEILTRWQDPTIEEYKKEIEKLNNKINKAIEDIQFCLKSICQEKGMSIDERTRSEMQTCIEVFKETLKVLQSR